MKLLLASLALAAFACTQANSFESPMHLTTLHKLAKVGGLKNGNRDIRPKITGGEHATPGRFYYQAGLNIDNSNFCGATIIHESYVLTTASCVYGGQTFTVYVGDIKLKSGQSVSSHEAIIHEKYDPNGFSYDIALIHLPNPLTFNDRTIDKINLPPNANFFNNIATISGWGTCEGVGLTSTLLFAQVSMISNEDCKASYGDLITDSHICAQPIHEGSLNNQGICHGDLGGPLVAMYDIENTRIEMALAGISAFINDRGCGVGPDGYTRVSTFVDWIKSHIE
ncbi:chymotrypsin-1-like [Ischnura elegans]|uniref:chymotrypsin-1-like n=1 Tax=Ischnura elegans TaxID=197161 RepID=UPI001ED8739D|nr:chymotrypsin-1-like [Ischnura elegans]